MSQYKLSDHMRSHTKERVIACPTCGSMFATKTKFCDHRRRQLPIERKAFGPKSPLFVNALDICFSPKLPMFPMFQAVPHRASPKRSHESSCESLQVFHV